MAKESVVFIKFNRFEDIDFDSLDALHRTAILASSGMPQSKSSEPGDMNPDPRLIHDAVLPEVVGDYEAAEA